MKPTTTILFTLASVVFAQQGVEPQPPATLPAGETQATRPNQPAQQQQQQQQQQQPQQQPKPQQTQSSDSGGGSGGISHLLPLNVVGGQFFDGNIIDNSKKLLDESGLDSMVPPALGGPTVDGDDGADDTPSPSPAPSPTIQKREPILQSGVYLVGDNIVPPLPSLGLPLLH